MKKKNFKRKKLTPKQKKKIEKDFKEARRNLMHYEGTQVPEVTEEGEKG